MSLDDRRDFMTKITALGALFVMKAKGKYSPEEPPGTIDSDTLEVLTAEAPKHPLVTAEAPEYHPVFMIQRVETEYFFGKLSCVVDCREILSAKKPDAVIKFPCPYRKEGGRHILHLEGYGELGINGFRMEQIREVDISPRLGGGYGRYETIPWVRREDRTFQFTLNPDKKFFLQIQDLYTTFGTFKLEIDW